MRVEVAYAKPQEQVLLEVEVEPGCTARQAVEASGILERFPEIDLATQRLGIFGKLASADAVLREGDRVEIYRALKADPKEVRKRRAAQAKSDARGGTDEGG